LLIYCYTQSVRLYADHEAVADQSPSSDESAVDTSGRRVLWGCLPAIVSASYVIAVQSSCCRLHPRTNLLRRTRSPA